MRAYILEEITTFTSDNCRKTFDFFAHRCSLRIEEEDAQIESLL